MPFTSLYQSSKGPTSYTLLNYILYFPRNVRNSKPPSSRGQTYRSVHSYPSLGSLAYFNGKVPKLLPSGCAYLKSHVMVSLEINRYQFIRVLHFYETNEISKKLLENLMFEYVLIPNFAFQYFGSCCVQPSYSQVSKSPDEKTSSSVLSPKRPTLFNSNKHKLLSVYSSDKGLMDKSHVMSRPFHDEDLDLDLDRSNNVVHQTLGQASLRDDWTSFEMHTIPPLPTHPPSHTDKPWWTTKSPHQTTWSPWTKPSSTTTTTPASWWDPWTTSTTTPKPTTTTTSSWWPPRRTTSKPSEVEWWTTKKPPTTTTTKCMNTSIIHDLLY